MSKNREINFIAVNPADIKANIEGGSHDRNHLFMDKEEKSFPSLQILRKTRQHLGKKRKPITQKTPLSNPDYKNQNPYLFMLKPLSVHYEIKPLSRSSVKHKRYRYVNSRE